jgi:hypothetical protein
MTCPTKRSLHLRYFILGILSCKAKTKILRAHEAAY